MKAFLSSLLCCAVTALASPVAPGAKPEIVADGFGLCDGPAWDGGAALFVPDVFGGKLYRYNPRTQKKSVVIEDAGRISATFYAFGKLYLSDNGNSRILTYQNGKTQVLAGHDPEKKMRPNDLTVHHDGHVYYTLTGQNQVWRIDPDGTHEVAIENIKTPNGIALSPDGMTLYVAAYAPKEIWAYTVGAHGLRVDAGARKFAELDKSDDAKGADGMTVDRAGNVYCAGPKAVWIWSPKGELLDKIVTPTRPINVAFAGPDPQSLYITCLGDKKNNVPSAMYRVAMRVSGLSPHVPQTEADANPKRPSTVIPKNVTAHLNTLYHIVDGRLLLMDIFRPDTPEGPKPAVIVVHGGGWLKGDKTKFRALAIALAKRGYVTAAIEYRLGGEAKFPAAIQDCFAAASYLRGQAKSLGIDPKRIGAVGGSAGGHLTGLMATGWKNKRLTGGVADPRIQASIVMAGPMQIDSGSVAERSRTGKGNANVWIGGDVDSNAEMYRLASADRHIDADSAPILFMVGEHDHPERNAPSREKLKTAGVWTGLKVYPDGKHGCWNQNPWFDRMVEDMDAFFKEKLGG